MTQATMTLADLRAKVAEGDAVITALRERLAKVRGDISSAEATLAWPLGHPDREDYDIDKSSRDGAYARLPGLRREAEILTRELREKEALYAPLKKELADRTGPLRSGLDFLHDHQTAQAPAWLVEGVLARGGNLLLAGPRKSLKTLISIDLALSLASATPFLGHFPVPERRRVVMLSGESGGPTLREAIRRIAAAKGIEDVASLDVRWGTELPTLERERRCDWFSVKLGYPSLSERLSGFRPDVVILDPLYLILTSGNSVNASNLFETGEALAALAGACGDATPVIVHHTGKSVQCGRPLDMEDMAFAGVQEYARQWFLLNRRRPFATDQPTDLHKLIVAYGGSAGHNGTLALDVDEGKLRPDFTGRAWRPTVSTLAEAKARDAEERAAASLDGKADRTAGYVAKLIAALPADGSAVSYTKARNASGLNTTALSAALEAAGDRVEVIKGEGRAGRFVRLKPVAGRN
jgi:hypothetical protein